MLTRRAMIAVSVSAFVAGAAEAVPSTRPLRVVLVPADGGTADGTRADFQPLFDALTRLTGEWFELTVAQSYGAATEALCGGVAEVGWFGAVSFLQAQRRGCGELLAIDVVHGSPTYFAGLFVRRESPVRSLADLRGRALAVGDVNSTSSFTYPLAMLMRAGVDPVRDLGAVRLTGSHANSLAALSLGQVDAAAASFDSFERAANSGAIRASEFRVLARSEPIPNPPLAIRANLPGPLKARLRSAFARIHDSGVDPELIRGYGGRRVDRYEVAFSADALAGPARVMALIDDPLKALILRKAARGHVP